MRVCVCVDKTSFATWLAYLISVNSSLATKDCHCIVCACVCAVGYGDMGPSTPGTRLFTVFYALFAIIVAAPSLGLIFSFCEDYKDASDAAVRMFIYKAIDANLCAGSGCATC